MVSINNKPSLVQVMAGRWTGVIALPDQMTTPITDPYMRRPILICYRETADKCVHLNMISEQELMLII